MEGLTFESELVGGERWRSRDAIAEVRADRLEVSLNGVLSNLGATGKSMKTFVAMLKS